MAKKKKTNSNSENDVHQIQYVDVYTLDVDKSIDDSISVNWI